MVETDLRAAPGPFSWPLPPFTRRFTTENTLLFTEMGVINSTDNQNSEGGKHVIETKPRRAALLHGTVRGAIFSQISQAAKYAEKLARSTQLSLSWPVQSRPTRPTGPRPIAILDRVISF